VDNPPNQLGPDVLLALLDDAYGGFALITHSPWQIHFANRTLAKWLGKSPADLCGLPLDQVFRSARQPGGLNEQLHQVLLDPELEIEITLAIESGLESAKTTRAKAFHVSGQLSPLVGLVLQPIGNDETDAACRDTRIDPLTALPDRAFLLSRLSTLLDGERVADREFAVLFIDLDNFKQINDRHGHLVGDYVLREVAARLQGCVRDGDHVTRYGGDEFVVLLERVSATAEIEPVLARARAALSEPFLVSHEPVVLSLSIGVAKSAPHLQSPEDVLNQADREMYAAKRSAAAASCSLMPTRC
jgi:diguanylate cyclase (GGDEF)-like protein